MGFFRKAKRLEQKKEIARVKKEHEGQELVKGKWVAKKAPVRKYNNRKIDRHVAGGKR